MSAAEPVVERALPASPAPSVYAWYVIAIFFVAAVLSYTDRLILNLLVDPIRHDLAISDTQFSYLQGAAFAVIYALVGLPIGRYADTHNRRNVIVFGIALWSVATAACGFAANFTEFFAARVFVGIGEATLAPAVMSMIPDYFGPSHRGTAIGIFLAGMTIGGGFAVAIGGVLLGAFASGALAFLPLMGAMPPWRATLVALAIPGVVLALLVLSVREPERVRAFSSAARASTAETLAFFAQRWRLFGLLFGGFALLQLIDYGFSAWLPTLFVRHFGQAAAEAGPRIGLVSIVFGGGGTLIGGFVADRAQRNGRTDARLRVTLAAIVCMAPFLFFPLAPSGMLVLAFYAAYTMIASLGSSAGLAATQDVVPADMRGFSVSLQAFAYTFFGLGVGPTIVAATTDYFYRDPSEVSAAMVTVALPAAVLAGVCLWTALRPYRAARAAIEEQAP